MDPNASLKELREGFKELKELLDTENEDVPSGWDILYGQVSPLLDRFEALDEWISRGGFLPSEWAKGLNRGTGEGEG